MLLTWLSAWEISLCVHGVVGLAVVVLCSGRLLLLLTVIVLMILIRGFKLSVFKCVCECVYCTVICSWT